MARRRRGRKTYKRRRLSKRRGWSRPTKKFSKTVKKIFNRQVETKYNQATTASVPIINQITDVQMVSIIPGIAQGVGQGDRLGNRIHPTRFTLKVVLTCLDIKNIIALGSPTYFDIYIFKYKVKNQYGGFVTAADAAQFLQDDNSSTFYNGGALDGLRPVNDDIFRLCIKKRVCLANNSSATATQGIQASINPNRCLYFNLTKYIKKMWSYDDAVQTLTNDNIYVAIGATQTDGASLGASSIGRYQLIVNLSYKDA